MRQPLSSAPCCRGETRGPVRLGRGSPLDGQWGRSGWGGGVHVARVMVGAPLLDERPPGASAGLLFPVGAVSFWEARACSSCPRCPRSTDSLKGGEPLCVSGQISTKSPRRNTQRALIRRPSAMYNPSRARFLITNSPPTHPPTHPTPSHLFIHQRAHGLYSGVSPIGALQVTPRATCRHVFTSEASPRRGHPRFLTSLAWARFK